MRIVDWKVLPQKICPLSNPLEPVNVSLFGTRIFADVTKGRTLRSGWIIWVNSTFGEECLYKRHTEERMDTEKVTRRQRQRVEYCGHKKKKKAFLLPFPMSSSPFKTWFGEKPWKFYFLWFRVIFYNHSHYLRSPDESGLHILHLKGLVV